MPVTKTVESFSYHFVYLDGKLIPGYRIYRLRQFNRVSGEASEICRVQQRKRVWWTLFLMSVWSDSLREVHPSCYATIEYSGQNSFEAAVRYIQFRAVSQKWRKEPV